MGLYGTHLVNQILAEPPLVHDATIHCVIVVSDYARYHSRYRLFRETYARLKATAGIKVYVVEAAFGDRSYEVTSASDPTHLQLRTNSEIWIKENMVNLGVRHLLPRDCRYIAWLDGDIEFRDPNWAVEAAQQAQHFAVLQPWQNCADLGPLGQITQSFASFGYLWQAGLPIQTHPSEPYRYGHSGFAWVARRDFWEAAEGLYDKAILGSGDHHMAWGCVGKAVQNSVHGGMSAGFKRSVQEWEDRVRPITFDQVGYSAGRIEHGFHGPKAKRGYRSRWDILIEHKFDPYTDLYYDVQGLLQLRGKPDLEAAIRSYNRSRDEDSISE